MCFLSNADAAPLPAETVFAVQATVIDANMFELRWNIQEGYFLYQDRIRLAPLQSDYFEIGSWSLPPAEHKLDHLKQIQAIYRQALVLRIPILGLQPGEKALTIHYQGCSDTGYCYPPQTQTFVMQIGENHGLQSMSPLSTVEKRPKQDATPSQYESLMAEHSIGVLILSFFGFGLLLAFTPCILPMIPVLSGIILSQPGAISPRKSFLLSCSYVLGLSLTYALLGAGVAFMGQNLQLVLQSSWAIGGLAGLFFILAFSMFDLYEIKLPSHWQQIMTRLSRRKIGTPYLSAAMMGSISTLILSPCVTPPLVGVLAYVAQTGAVGLGALALFFLGLGSGTPLLILSASATHILPKAGQWMYSIKIFFGIMLLIVAIQLLSAIVPAVVTMFLWGVLALIAGVFMGALLPAHHPWEKIRQSLGILLLMVGGLILTGASMGNVDPLQPLANVQSVHLAESAEVKSIKVTTFKQLKAALKKFSGQPIILDFYADWCKSCQIMKRTVMKSKQVIQASSGIRWITVDVTPNNRASQVLLRAFNVMGPPTFIFIDKTGEEIQSLRLVGEVSKSTLIAHVKKL